jgi:hypothetical protein
MMYASNTPAQKGIVRKNYQRTPPQSESDSPDNTKKTRMGETSLENSDQPSFDESDTDPTFSNPDFAKLKAWFEGQFELIRIDIGIVRTENDDLKQQLEDLRMMLIQRTEL